MLIFNYIIKLEFLKMNFVQNLADGKGNLNVKMR